MTRIDKVFKKLSDFYEFHRKIKMYTLKKQAGKPPKEDAATDRHAG